MSEVVMRNQRHKQILSLLGFHGPLCSRVLLHLLQPPIKRRRLHDSLARLLRKGFITVRNDKLFGGRGTFYQITRDPTKKAEVAEFLECSEEKITQPLLRNQLLQHNQLCVIWEHQIAQLYPAARVVRDRYISADSESKKLLRWQGDDYELLPDLLVVFPTTKDRPKCSIAIEIEKSRKDHKRLLKKVNKYARNSLLDGVIYVSEDEYIIESIRSIYRAKVLPKTIRIKQYSDYFFMFSNATFDTEFEKLLLFSTSAKTSKASMWISYLSTTQSTERRNKDLDLPATIG